MPHQLITPTKAFARPAAKYKYNNLVLCQEKIVALFAQYLL